MTHKNLAKSLKGLNITKAIADPHASVNGYPAILLRWNGQEHYYLGTGMDPLSGEEADFEYENWLKARWGNENL